MSEATALLLMFSSQDFFKGQKINWWLKHLFIYSSSRRHEVEDKRNVLEVTSSWLSPDMATAFFPAKFPRNQLDPFSAILTEFRRKRPPYNVIRKCDKNLVYNRTVKRRHECGRRGEVAFFGLFSTYYLRLEVHAANFFSRRFFGYIFRRADRDREGEELNLWIHLYFYVCDWKNTLEYCFLKLNRILHRSSYFFNWLSSFALLTLFFL